MRFDNEKTADASINGPLMRRAVPARAAFKMLGIGRTTGYRLISEGQLAAFKIGGKTLIEIASIDRLIATAPRAGSVDKLAA